MSLDADVRRLAGARPLDKLPREALQLLAFSCQKRSLHSGEALFAAGEAAEGAFFVLEGEIVLRRDQAERRAGAGVLIGEQALLAQTLRPADATAARESLLLSIPRETFRRVLSEFPESAEKIHRDQLARTRKLVAALEGVQRRAFARRA
ncbi:MAG: Crp/Fnr family transcriptional regulator [Pseudomonadota bacterium]|nr:Crp/Fnr family transcriptional regulator [Pseudomonadota bacterium]